MEAPAPPAPSSPPPPPRAARLRILSAICGPAKIDVTAPLQEWVTSEGRSCFLFLPTLQLRIAYVSDLVLREGDELLHLKTSESSGMTDACACELPFTAWNRVLEESIVSTCLAHLAHISLARSAPKQEIGVTSQFATHLMRARPRRNTLKHTERCSSEI